MSKWIKKTFQVEIPDYPFSLKRERNLVQEWTYEGPDKIICFVWKEGDVLDPSRGWFDVPDDESLQKEHWDTMVTLAGLAMYPAIISFEKDPLIIALIRQGSGNEEEECITKYVKDQKVFYWDGTEEIYPLSDDSYEPIFDKDGQVCGKSINKKKNWMYSIAWPMRPGMVVQPGYFLYDKVNQEVVKPYPKRKPQITTQEFLYVYYRMIDSINNFIDNECMEMPPKKREPYIKYRDELVALQEKAKFYWDKPWMITFPQDPRMNRDDFYKIETFQVYDGPNHKLEVTPEILQTAADKVNMSIPNYLY